jgi:hypothetical protein
MRVPPSPRSDSRLPPICNRHGQPDWSNRSRQPVRSPSSARRPTQRGSPVTSATSAHSPGRKCSSGRRVSKSTAPTPTHWERLFVLVETETICSSNLGQNPACGCPEPRWTDSLTLIFLAVRTLPNPRASSPLAAAAQLPYQRSFLPGAPFFASPCLADVAVSIHIRMAPARMLSYSGASSAT